MHKSERDIQTEVARQAEKEQPSSGIPHTYSKRHTFLVTILLAPGAGLAASLMAAVTMGVLFFVAGTPSPVELFGDHVLKHIDVNTFLRLLLTFGPNAKTLPLGLALLGMITVGTLLSWLYAALVQVKLPTTGYRPIWREWLIALALTGAMTLFGVLLFWDELRQNHFGLPIEWAVLASAIGLLVDFSVYGVVLCLAYRALLPKHLQSRVPIKAQERRQFLTQAGVAVLSVGAGAGTFGLIRAYLNNSATYDGMKTWPHNNMVVPITPNSEHYVVTQNLIDPTPNIDLWRLEVTGLVNQAGTYTYTEIQKLPSISRAITLECIANGVGDHLISTAIWQGVTLRTLLDLHKGAQATAKYIAFYSIDGYNISLPLDEVLAADAVLAWRMNGTELPLRHGYPLRVLVPGRYGEENPKWLARVELTDHFVQGLYSSQGWYNGPLHTMSRIDHPRGKLAQGRLVEVGGIAFAGNRGIQQVEVSVDGGTTWQQASLDPPLSPDSWVFWKWQWKPLLPGRYLLTARATDGQGEVQTSRKQGTVPNGATGYHQVSVVIE